MTRKLLVRAYGGVTSRLPDTKVLAQFDAVSNQGGKHLNIS